MVNYFLLISSQNELSNHSMFYVATLIIRIINPKKLKHITNGKRGTSRTNTDFL
jgi:hypothetical protein